MSKKNIKIEIEKEETKLEKFLGYLAGICACVGVGAIVYKLYTFGLTKENITDASINLAQILTVTATVFLSVKISKNDIRIRKRKFYKRLDEWNTKYGVLNKFEKGNLKSGEFVYCKMLRHHTSILKDESELKPSAYIDFAKVPAENFTKNNLIFFFNNKTFNKVSDKNFHRYINIIKENIEHKFFEIIRNAEYTEQENEGKLIIRFKNIQEHIISEKILDLLDYMTMITLAVA